MKGGPQLPGGPDGRPAGGVAGWILRLAALLAPRSRRQELVRQWTAELAYRAQRRLEGGRVGADGPWALGALRHAGELRRLEAGMMEGVWMDVKQAVKALVRRPGITLLATGIFAVGIGVGTAVFTIVDSVLFRPFPFPQPESLFSVSMANPTIGMDQVSVTWPDFEEFREVAGVEAAAVHMGSSIDLADGDVPERVRVQSVGGGFFEALRAEAVLGRLLGADDQRADAPPTVVLSELTWRVRYGSDPEVVGRTIRLDGEPHTVVGILRSDHTWPTEARAWTALRWGSLVPEWAAARNNHTWQMVTRAADGVTPAAISERFTAISLRARSSSSGENADWRTRADTFHGAQTGDRVALVFVLMTSAVLALVLIASFNVAGLLLVRASERARDFSLRSALGADRKRLFRQLMAESGILALVGGLIGMAIGVGAIRLAARLSPDAIPRLEGATLNLPVLLVALGISLIAALVGGMAPGLQAARTDVSAALKEGATAASANRGRRRLQRGLVIAELALSTVLLIGAGIFNRALNSALNRDPGFESENIVAFSVRPPATRYPNDAEVRDFFDRASTALGSTPGVDGVALTSTLPLGIAGTRLRRSFLLDGMPDPPEGTDVAAQWIEVDPEFFEVLGMRPTQGRSFVAEDGADAPPVIMVNETMARSLNVEGGVLGRSIRSWYDEDIQREIVGVVADFRMDDTEMEDRPLVIVPRAQAMRRSMSFVLRTTGELATLAPLIRDRIAALDPDLAVDNLGYLKAQHREAISTVGFVRSIFTTFGAAALILGTIGIYGLVAFTVSLQTREIGIRMAIGASRSSVRRQVLREGAVLTTLGLALGGIIGGVFAFAIAQVLNGQEWFDPAVWIGVPALLGMATLLATAVPAIRATRIDPARALSSD